MAPTKEEVEALLAGALKELATLPDEDVRLVLQAAQQLKRAMSGATEMAAAQVVLAGGAVAGKTSITGELAVTLVPVTLEGTGRMAGGATLVRAPAIKRALDNPDVRAVLLGLLTSIVYDGAKLAIKQALALLAAGQLTTAQPAPSGEPPPPSAAIEPAPQLPADICLPTGGVGAVVALA